MRVNLRAAGCALFILTLLATSQARAGSNVLTGKMSIYNVLLAGTWSCSADGSTYSAVYAVAPGNALHGHLYSAHGSEDAYFGYNLATHRYWTVNDDSSGATETQTSSDGAAYTGTLNDGSATSKATNVFTIVNSRKWTVHAKGTAGGKPYDLTATCVRA
jgi:hypothetical protein